MDQLDSLLRQQLESLLQTTDDISHHTNAWDNLTSGAITLLTIFAAIATIFGLVLVWKEIRIRHFTKVRQTLLLKDLIRHLFVNSSILEALEIKSQNDWEKVRPAEGIFLRFSVLENDLKLGDISVDDEDFLRLHSLCVFLRNYNISVALAEKNFNSQIVSLNEKKALIDDLWNRTERLVNELIELGCAAKLLQGTLENTEAANREIAQFIIEYYRKENANITPIQLPQRTGPKSVFDRLELGLKNEFDKRITQRLNDILVVDF